MRAIVVSVVRVRVVFCSSIITASSERFRKMERRLLAKGLRGMVHLAGVWPGIVSCLS